MWILNFFTCLTDPLLPIKICCYNFQHQITIFTLFYARTQCKTSEDKYRTWQSSVQCLSMFLSTSVFFKEHPCSPDTIRRIAQEAGIRRFAVAKPDWQDISPPQNTLDIHNKPESPKHCLHKPSRVAQTCFRSCTAEVSEIVVTTYSLCEALEFL